MKNVAIIIVATIVFVIILHVVADELFGAMMYPVQGKITSPFGPRTAPKEGASTYHSGIDIAVPSGTPVKSPAAGTVLSQWSEPSGGGTQMKVKLKNGYTAGFAHLSGYTVNVGDAVRKGQVIAKSGATGNVTGPHLHFTMRDPKGNLVDPQKLLA